VTFENAKKQIEKKPAKLARFMKFNKPRDRKFGRNLKPCRRCGKTEGVIHKYGLHYCRQCFREVASELGFEKFE
jgi:small subunit ribosomal protein S14